MSLELVHTSASRGLKQGVRGFCTVSMTRGLPINLAERLEALSSYRFWFDAAGPDASSNAPAFSHCVISVGGRSWSVVSRIAPAPPDYSGRTNKIAHHHAVESSEFALAGPAWLASQPGLFREAWPGEPSWIESPRRLPVDGGEAAPGCASWNAACGDAGWAGELARAWREGRKGSVFVLTPPGTDALRLVAEAVSLLPPEERWDATFTTCLAGEMPPEVRCLVRFLPNIPEAARLARSAVNALVIDLQRAGRAPDNEFTAAAREGRRLEPVVSATVTPRIAAAVASEDVKSAGREQRATGSVESALPDLYVADTGERKHRPALLWEERTAQPAAGDPFGTHPLAPLRFVAVGTIAAAFGGLAGYFLGAMSVPPPPPATNPTQAVATGAGAAAKESDAVTQLANLRAEHDRWAEERRVSNERIEKLGIELDRVKQQLSEAQSRAAAASSQQVTTYTVGGGAQPAGTAPSDAALDTTAIEWVQTELDEKRATGVLYLDPANGSGAVPPEFKLGPRITFSFTSHGKLSLAPSVSGKGGHFTLPPKSISVPPKPDTTGEIWFHGPATSASLTMKWEGATPKSDLEDSTLLLADCAGSVMKVEFASAQATDASLVQSVNDALKWSGKCASQASFQQGLKEFAKDKDESNKEFWHQRAVLQPGTSVAAGTLRLRLEPGGRIVVVELVPEGKVGEVLTAEEMAQKLDALDKILNPPESKKKESDAMIASAKSLLAELQGTLSVEARRKKVREAFFAGLPPERTLVVSGASGRPLLTLHFPKDGQPGGNP